MSMRLEKGISIFVFLVGVAGFFLIMGYNGLQHQNLRFQFGIIDRALILLSGIFIVSGLSMLLLDSRKIRAKHKKYLKTISRAKCAVVIALFSLSAYIAGYLHSYLAHKPASEDQWAIGVYTSSQKAPLSFSGVNIPNPVLTKDDVSDVEAVFVADPFLIFVDDVFYMFFEVGNAKTRHGDIGLAMSQNGFDWTYQKIILDERFHLSYPCVFRSENDVYMIPETKQKKSIRLYRAVEFPYLWVFEETLLEGENFVDTTILRYQDTWWLFTQTAETGVLRLFFSPLLSGPWHEHPHSPIVNGDKNFSRPAGNVVVCDNRIIRYAQDCEPYYGNQVWAFEITKLTPQTYEENQIGDAPVLKGHDNWNTRGMHHISPWRLGSKEWIACVDGR